MKAAHVKRSRNRTSGVSRPSGAPQSRGISSSVSHLNGTSLATHTPSNLKQYNAPSISASSSATRSISTTSSRHQPQSSQMSRTRVSHGFSTETTHSTGMDILMSARRNTIPILETNSNSLLRCSPSRAFSSENTRRDKDGNARLFSNNMLDKQLDAQREGFTDAVNALKSRARSTRSQQWDKLSKQRDSMQLPSGGNEQLLPHPILPLDSSRAHDPVNASLSKGLASATFYRPSQFNSVSSKQRKVEPDYMNGRPYYDISKYPYLFPPELVKVSKLGPEFVDFINFFQTEPTHEEVMERRRVDSAFDKLIQTHDPYAHLDDDESIRPELFEGDAATMTELTRNHPDRFFSAYDPHNDKTRSVYKKAEPVTLATVSREKPTDSIQPGLDHNPNFARKPVQLLNISPGLLRGKTVLVRMDFNVNIVPDEASGELVVRKTSYKRLMEALPTIQYLIESGSNIVLMSHLGDPKKGERDDKLSLRPVAKSLSELLNHPVSFVEDCVGEVVSQTIHGSSDAQLDPGAGGARITLLENLRFHPGEKKNDPAFAEQIIATVKPDVYVNDAFGTSHRAHASIIGIPTALKKLQSSNAQEKTVPCVSGLLISKELDAFTPFVNIDPREIDQEYDPHITGEFPPERTLILGGAKLQSKLPVIQGLLPLLSTIIIGGQLAFPFIVSEVETLRFMSGTTTPTPNQIRNPNALPYAFRSTSLEEVAIARAIQTEITDRGIISVTPVDLLMANPIHGNSAPPRRMSTLDVYCENANLQAYDIGHGTMGNIANVLQVVRSRLKQPGAPQYIFWNGPPGKFEMDNFAQGTEAIIEELSKCTKEGVKTLIGGGETAETIEIYRQRYPEKDIEFSHISTGGGASLELLAGTHLLPGLDGLDKL